jgi:hypothetical protein
MTLRQQQQVVPGMLYQTPAGFHQPLLQAGQRPPVNPHRQRQPPLNGQARREDRVRNHSIRLA